MLLPVVTRASRFAHSSQATLSLIAFKSKLLSAFSAVGIGALSANSGQVGNSRAASGSLYGGQAVIEGVMIRGVNNCAVAVRRMDGTIARHDLPLVTWTGGVLRRIPLVRGVLVLIETLVIGSRAYTIASNEQLASHSGEEGAELGKFGAGLMITAGLLIGLGLFFIIPLFASRTVEDQSALLANIVEGALRLLIFLAYIWVIGFLPDIKRMYGYHGAEHMTIHAYEAGLPLTHDAIRRFSPAHPRCGTSFLLTVVVVSILFFILLPREPLWFLIGSRIVLIPVIAAVSYEFIRFTGVRRHLRLVRWIGMPNLWLQSLTTQQPDDEMIEVAVSAMETVLRKDQGGDEELASEDGEPDEAND